MLACGLFLDCQDRGCRDHGYHLAVSGRPSLLKLWRNHLIQDRLEEAVHNFEMIIHNFINFDRAGRGIVPNRRTDGYFSVITMFKNDNG